MRLHSPTPLAVDKLVRAGGGLLSSSRSAKLDAELIMAHVLRCDRAGVYKNAKQTLAPVQYERFQALINERRRGRPIAQITGVQEFWSLPFEVDDTVLIPRPETELLVEVALTLVRGTSDAKVADLGSGCGAIAVAVAKERPDVNVIAVEKSPAALRVAARNCAMHSASNVSFLRASWLGCVAPRTFNLIVSNPPYVRDDDPALRDSEIRFEPRDALAASEGGVRELRLIIESAGNALIANGGIALEHGYNQGPAVRDLLDNNGFAQIATQCDLAGHDRVTHGRYNRT